MDSKEMSDGNGQTASKDLLYAEKFQESPFLLKKKNPGSPPRIFRVSESSVLKNVQMFLPKMKAANTELEEKLKVLPASALDIENTEDAQGPLIEMDLALIPQDNSSEESDNESESSNDSDNDLDDITSEIKLPTGGSKKGNSKIEILNCDSNCESDNT